MLKVPVLQFINGIADKFCCGAFGRFVGREIPHVDSMFSFALGADHWCGIVGNNWICGQACRDHKGGTPGVDVSSRGFNKPNEVVVALFVVWYVEEEGI